MSTETGSPRTGRVTRAMKRALMVIGGITVAFMLLILLTSLVATLRRETVPSRVILELDLERGIIEAVPEDPFGALIRREEMTVRDVVEGLERARTDDRVVGLIARIGAGGIGLAQVEELRSAIRAFRTSGKPAIAFAETFGEFTAGQSAYYLATAFDEIHLQPSGDVGLTGLIAEVPFLAGTLDMVGLETQMDHRYEYKDALNTFTERAMTEPQREATARVLESIYQNLIAGIAEGRGMDPAEARRIVDGGPYFGAEAVEAGLVDGLAYRDAVYDSLEARLGGGELLYLEHYLARAGTPYDSGPTVALIYGTGVVQRGESQVDPLVGGTVMGAATVTRAFRAAIEADDVEAIVFRIDSPGGSYVASDAIWREVVRAREAGKPVIATMGNVAGSGGYFVAMGADRIVAQPSTITGSIGVFGGKVLIDEASENLGVTWDDVRVGGNATMWSNVQDYSPEEWARVQANLDRIYEDFTAKVAQGRGLSRDSTHAIARGRIWTGADARRLGLVDELGGFDVALRLARELAGLEPDDPIRLRVYPRERTVLEMLLDRRPSSSEAAALRTLAGLGSAVEAVLGRARQLGIYPTSPGVLTMPAVPVIR